MTKINVKLDLKAKKTVEKTVNFEGDVPTGTIEITENGDYDVASYANANVNVEDVPAVVEPVTVNPTTSQQVIEPKEGVDGFNKVTVNAVDPEQYYKPEESKTVTPSTTAQTITPSAGKVINEINVEAVDESIDSNISAENIKKDVTILGVTGEFEGESPEAGKYYYAGEDDVQLQSLNYSSGYLYNSDSEQLEELGYYEYSGYYNFNSDKMYYEGSSYPGEYKEATHYEQGYYSTSGSFDLINGSLSQEYFTEYSTGIYKSTQGFKATDGSLSDVSTQYISSDSIAFFRDYGEIADIDSIMETTALPTSVDEPTTFTVDGKTYQITLVPTE